MSIDYILADPTGNITVLIRSFYRDPDERSRMISEAFTLEPSCEQAGFIITRKPGCISLEMMGYEFCGNAVLSAASWQAFTDGYQAGDQGGITVHSSGTEAPLEVTITRLKDTIIEGRPQPVFVGSVIMPEPALGSYKDYPLISMSGISHLIIPASGCTPAQAETLIRSYAEELRVPALGIILCSELTEKSLRIKPLVYVPESGTMIWEHGCATGSTAAGCYMFHKGLARGCVDVIQPGGVIRIASKESGLTLTGRVILHV